MIFENLQVAPEQLPQIQQVQFEKLESDYLWMRVTSLSIFMLFVLGAVVVLSFTTDIKLWVMASVWLALLILGFIVQMRGFKIKGYALREHDISYKSGLFFFSMTSVPFNRIQHCEVTQGPLARLFDLASVKVYTAGGSSSDLSIGGLKKEEAHRLRDHISSISSKHA
jgi:membrane protein YdbS with pleckstrin-like domain